MMNILGSAQECGWPSEALDFDFHGDSADETDIAIDPLTTRDAVIRQAVFDHVRALQSHDPPASSTA
jgi:hypothetical protein